MTRGCSGNRDSRGLVNFREILSFKRVEVEFEAQTAGGVWIGIATGMLGHGDG